MEGAVPVELEEFLYSQCVDDLQCMNITAVTSQQINDDDKPEFFPQDCFHRWFPNKVQTKVW